ncbi:MAG TPA: hypothetical protein VM241_06155 [Candidatus Thermoplasmatota archaeon]|nr:hypothetical protein [Candidatus Thermoplasmatota archaeon]
MRFPRRSAAALATVVAALLAAPPGAAQPTGAQLVVHSVAFEGVADQAGTLAFLFLAGNATSLAAPHLHAEGRHIEARQYDEDGYEVQTSDVGGPDQSTLRALNFLTPNPGKGTGFDAARLDLADAAPDYQLHVFATEGGLLAGNVADGREQVLKQPELTRHGLVEHGDKGTGVPLGPAADALSGEGDAGYWSLQAAKGAHVLTEATSGALRLTGTFTIEVLGLDFRLAGEGRTAELKSGTTRSSLAPVGADGADRHLHAIHQSFLRITVTDGALDLGVPAARLFQWSGPAADTTTDSASLEDATGSVQLANGQQQRLTGAAYRLDGRYAVQANPSDQGLQLAVTGLDAAGQPLDTASATVRQAASPIYWAAAAAVACSAGITLLILGLRRRQPTMSDVESALEAGHFGRAARDARRLLRRRPGFEDAVISRAIALSKLGRNQRVVREIHAHFARQEPSDGVLHYVLGLALKETGAPADARAAWQEALRRTPGLLPQVQPLLGGQQASSTPSAVMPPVDGTAYA